MHHLVGAAEVAEILGVTRQHVSTLAATEPDFPEPEVQVQAGKIWRRADIEAWRDARVPRKRGPKPKNAPPE